jgi:hypothetical protein
LISNMASFLLQGTATAGIQKPPRLMQDEGGCPWCHLLSPQV